MNVRPTKTMWIGLMCVGVLLYLLMLGQVTIQQFESKLLVRSQKNLLALAQARQRHCNDLLDQMTRQLRYTAYRMSGSDAAGESVFGWALFWDRAVLSVDRTDAQGAVTDRLYGPAAAKPHSDLSAAAVFHRPRPDPGVVFVMDDLARPPHVALLYPLYEGEAFGGMLILRISVAELLGRLDQDAGAQGIRTCLVNGEGRILSGDDDTEGRQPLSEICAEDGRGRSLLEDIGLGRGGIGTFDGRTPDAGAPYGFLAGHWPLEGFDAAWSVAAVQDDRAIKTAVVEHARNIQLGMVCLFLTVFMIWLLFYHSSRRQILVEQQTALGHATEELYHVSEQNRRARRALEQQIRLYRSLLDAIPMGLYWKDSDGRTIGYNSEYAHIAGIKRMEEGSAPMAPIERQQDGLPLDMEVMSKDIELLYLPQRYSHGGGAATYLISKIAVKDEHGRVCGLLGGLLNRDLLTIGQDHSFCGALKTECVCALLPIPTLVLDTGGRVLCSNDAFLRRFEIGASPASAQPLRELLPAEASGAIEAVLDDLGRLSCAETKRFYVRCGTDRFRATAQPILKNESLHAILLVLGDAGTQKQSEDYLEELLFRYRKIVNRLSGQLDLIGRKAQRLLQRRSPISTAMLNELQYAIGACREQASHGDLLSSEATALAETRDGTVSTERLAEAVERRLAESYAEAAPPFETALGTGCPGLFKGNWHRLYQTLAILAEQAVACAGNSGITLRIDGADIAEGGIRMTFAVEHSGKPEPGGDTEQIIDPTVSLSQWYPGCANRDSAMNLRIAARLLDRMGQRLRIASMPGQTRYCFDLDTEAVAAADPLGASDRTAPQPEPKLHREAVDMQDQHHPAERRQPHRVVRILVVDDIEENRALLDVLLNKLGYAVVPCGGGKEAIDLCRKDSFDLILMDIQMPDVDGLEAIRQIRAESRCAGVPIIAMTASSHKDDELAALESGCDDYLNKPINRKLLEQKIWRSLAKMRQISEAEAGLDIMSFLDGDPDYHKTIETFVENLPTRIEEMRQAAEKHNYKDLAFKVHALKGLGGFAGFSVYTEKAARLEESIREQDVDTIQSRIDEMMQMCLRTKIKTDTQ